MSEAVENLMKTSEEKGRAEGKEIGGRETTLSFARRGIISLSTAAEDLGMTEQQVKTLL